jgi:hypothetical protein
MKISGVPTGVSAVPRRAVHGCAAFLAALVVIGLAASCGGGYGSSNNGGSGGGGLSASITNGVSTIPVGSSYTFNATTPSSNGYTSGITWSLSPSTGAGTLTNVMNSGYSSSVMYTAPSTAPNPNSVTIIATPSDTHVAAAKDTFMISASGMAMFKGQFAVELSGSDPAGESLAAVGSLVADGAGNITGGALDLNRNRAPSVHLLGVAGTYTLDANMHGAVSLAALPGSNRPLAFSFVLAPDQQSGVISGSDSGGVGLSGRMFRQDPAAFSLSSLSTDFVFRLETNSADRLATIGKFAIGGNAVLSGIADQSKAGVDPVFGAAPISGRLTAQPDATGRSAFALATPGENTHFVFYVVSASRLLLLETDSGGAARDRQIGLADRQALPFSAATADASTRIHGSGFDTHASSFSAVSVEGALAIQNLTHATLSWDAVTGGSAVSIDSLRSDLVTFDPATGRGTIQIANGAANNFADAVVFYLASPGNGFFLDKTAGRFNRAIAGDLETANRSAKELGK